MYITITAILQLFLVILLGFYLYRKGILKDEALSFLTNFVVNLAVPALIFSNIVTSFYPDKMPSLWTLIGLSAAIFLLGLILGVGFSLSVPKESKKEFISLISFQNAGYLPMNIALFLLPGCVRKVFLTYIFLYLLGFNILMWSVGSFLFLRKKMNVLN